MSAPGENWATCAGVKSGPLEGSSGGSQSLGSSAQSEPGRTEVVGVEQWAEMRRLHFVNGLSQREIRRRTGLHRDTIRNAVNSNGNGHPGGPCSLPVPRDRDHRPGPEEQTAREPRCYAAPGRMELGGLEPPTSWVRSRRSPN